MSDEAKLDDATLSGFEGIGVSLSATVTEDMAGKRIDQVAAAAFAEFSREQLKQWLISGALTLDGEKVKPKQRVRVGQHIQVCARIERHSEDKPEKMALDIIYEDSTLLVVNKPCGLVVHPGAGNLTGTLVNGLLHHDPQLTALPRAGLVHRIDKDTSGLLVVAKTAGAQQHLSAQLKQKSVYRHYIAVVFGQVAGSGRVDAPIARHPVHRTKMAVAQPSNVSGKSAVSHYERKQQFANTAVVTVTLETGRTHQIRVHMAHIGHPLVGDVVYTRAKRTKTMSQAVFEYIKAFPRQALHAYKLGFIHPETAQSCMFEAPMPADMQLLVDKLNTLDQR